MLLVEALAVVTRAIERKSHGRIHERWRVDDAHRGDVIHDFLGGKKEEIVATIVAAITWSSKAVSQPETAHTMDELQRETRVRRRQASHLVWSLGSRIDKGMETGLCSSRS